MATTTKQVAAYGSYGHRVTVVQTADKFVVRWHEGAAGAKRPRQQSWPKSAANRQVARAFAEALAADLAAGGGDPTQAREDAPDVTVAGLFAAYEGAEFRNLRTNTRRMYRDDWSKWTAFVGGDVPAATVPRNRLAEFRAALEGRGYAPRTIRSCIHNIQRIYRWGVEEDVIPAVKLTSWRFKLAKDERRESPDEFSMDEFRALLGTFDPTHGGQWRGYCALALCGFQGARQHAVLHLQWADVDMDAGRIVWRAEWDKQGREWSQPLRAPSRDALAVAWAQRERAGYSGPWVFYGGRVRAKAYTPGDRTSMGQHPDVYSKQSLWLALRAAERRAGVAHRAHRAGHGLRRLLAGEVAALTGNAVEAMRAIGDRDVRMASRYLKDRDERMAGHFAALDDALAEGPAAPDEDAA